MWLNVNTLSPISWYSKQSETQNRTLCTGAKGLWTSTLQVKHYLKGLFEYRMPVRTGLQLILLWPQAGRGCEKDSKFRQRSFIVLCIRAKHGSLWASQCPSLCSNEDIFHSPQTVLITPVPEKICIHILIYEQWKWESRQHWCTPHGHCAPKPPPRPWGAGQTAGTIGG